MGGSTRQELGDHASGGGLFGLRGIDELACKLSGRADLKRRRRRGGAGLVSAVNSQPIILDEGGPNLP
jgi:hypothetical protein